MPEENNKPMTIRFAGREIDAHDFVDLATKKAVQWMDYQQLQGDERTDFIKSFNEVLQGIVDNKYEISEFGKILGLPETSNYYTEHDGTKKDGEGKWYNRKRVGFNPYGNVETYLNGIARLAKEYKAPDTTPGKKAWKKGMLNTLLGNAVFGEGNNQIISKNTGQLEAWANQYDPIKGGSRTTSGRRQFIIDNVLDPYEKALKAGEYNIDETSLQTELTNIANLRKNINSDFELGKIFPLASHYLFTGERYMTASQKADADLKAKRDTYTSGQAEYSDDLGYSTEERTAADQLRQTNIDRNRAIEFDNFNKLGTYAIPESVEYEKGVNHSPEVIDDILQRSIPSILRDEDWVAYEFFNNVDAKEINKKRYYPSWDTGDLFIITRDEKNNIHLQVQDLKSAIRTSKVRNQNLYNYLRESWNTWKGYESYKKGGVLKASLGDPMPHIDPDEEGETTTPTTTSTDAAPKSTQQITNWTIADPLKKDPLNPYNIQKTLNLKIDYNFNPSLNGGLKGPFGQPAPTNTLLSEHPLGEYKLPEVNLPYIPKEDGKSMAVPRNNETGRGAKNWNTKAKSDYMIDALAFGKGLVADFYNQRVLDKMTSLQAVHKVPLRKEYLMHTSKPIENAIANNNADFNQLGAVQAMGTSDQGDAFARRLAAEKAKHDANNPLVAKQAEMTMTQSDKALENENNNFANLHEVGESNHAADVALHNYNRQQEAEFYSRQGRQRVSQITEQQKGIAESAQKNFERERDYSVYNNKDYVELEQAINSCQEEIFSIDAELKELGQDPTKNEALIKEKEAERNRLVQQARMYAYKKSALEQRLLKVYDAEHITPYGFAWGIPGTVYQRVSPNPVNYRKSGGKMELAEKEKTKRMYAKMLFDMMKLDMNHMYKQNRDAYKDYRKIFMQQNK